MTDSPNRSIPPLLSYAAISAALLIPVLIWPLQEINSGHLNPAAILFDHPVWLISASALLLCAVTADSILYHQPDSIWPFYATAWILVSSMAASMALRIDSGAFVLGGMFALHAMRSGLRLWSNQQQWWLWAACLRDALAALILFGWILFLTRSTF